MWLITSDLSASTSLETQVAESDMVVKKSV